MISQKWSKLIRSLHQKKYRKAEQLFIVEGEKAVLELLSSNWQVQALFATDTFLQQHRSSCDHAKIVELCSSEELVKVGTFSSNDSALAVVTMPANVDFEMLEQQWVLVLDQINDPGNLGTIIRVADWYGIHHIVCSPDTADVYNPKVIAAAKGSFLRVQLHYQPLLPLLQNNSNAIYGAVLNGESVHRLSNIPQGGYLVLGNEANGISPAITTTLSKKITIPGFGNAESLNVGVAAAIICDNFRRISA